MYFSPPQAWPLVRDGMLSAGHYFTLRQPTSHHLAATLLSWELCQPQAKATKEFLRNKRQPTASDSTSAHKGIAVLLSLAVVICSGEFFGPCHRLLMFWVSFLLAFYYLCVWLIKIKGNPEPLSTTSWASGNYILVEKTSFGCTFSFNSSGYAKGKEKYSQKKDQR